MRLMLGTTDKPGLLVSVDDVFNRADFKFKVINGGWSGIYNNGEIRVQNYGKVILSGILILCEDQDRLRGDYNDVFDNFNNINYVAPKIKYKVNVDSWDDDIPF